MSNPPTEGAPERLPPNGPGTAVHSPSEPPSTDAVPASEPHAHVSVLARIKEHKIAQWTLAYAAFAFATLHVVTLLSDALEWPHIVVRSVTLLLIVGVPIVPTLAWYHGVQALKRVSGSELIIIALLLAIGGSLLWLVPRPVAERARTQTEAVVAKTENKAEGFTAPARSIAVLPFADMSEKHDQEYFADGMAEEVINLLVKVPELHVPARTSSFYFKDKSEDIPTIAKRLMVAYVLEGSVRQSGSHLRITAQLVRAESGFHLWSETYDRKLDDIFKVQDEIAGAVVKALKVSLLTSETPSATPTTSTEAYTLYLQARAIALRAGQADYEAAIRMLRQALTLDPKFAAAWAELANDFVDRSYWIESGLTADNRGETYRAAAQAIEFDSNLSDGHLAMAKLLYYIDWHWDAAEVEFEKALTLNPRNADALRQTSYLAATLGRADQALQLAQRAVVQDPLNSWNFNAVASALLDNGRSAEAEANLHKALELNPTGAGLHSGLGLTLLVRGDPAAALAEIDRETDDLSRETRRPIVIDALGRTSEADREIMLLEKNYATRAGFSIAEIFACRNDAARTFAWLDRAYRQHDAQLIWLKYEDSCIKNLKADPRYKAFLKRMNLPE